MTRQVCGAARFHAILLCARVRGQVVHLSLQLRRGDDAAVKAHLSSRLTHVAGTAEDRARALQVPCPPSLCSRKRRPPSHLHLM